MDGMNQNNNDNYIPQEIPIPGAQDNSASDEKDQNSPYGQQSSPNDQQPQNSPYGQQSSPYDQQPQNSAYGQQSSPYNQQSSPYNQPPQNNNNPYGQQLRPYNPQGQRNNAPVKIIIGAACALAVVLAAAIGALAYFRSTPAYKISKGFQNLGKEISQTKNPLAEKIGLNDILLMMEEDGSHVETALNFSAELPLLGDTTLGVDTDFYKDMHAKELSADTSFSLMNYEFGHLNVYADEDVFCFSVPELFMENMYIENENVVSQYNRSRLADYGEPSDAEDFSIDLFPDADERIPLRDWKNPHAVFKRLEEDLEACRDGMKIEKAGKGLYRVTLPAKETNRLFRDFVENYGKLYSGGKESDEYEMAALGEYDRIIASDIAILFEIDAKNHIESIALEEPVQVLDGEGSVAGELFFMGEKRSIDKLQGKVALSGADGSAAEVLCQVVQNITQDDYQIDMDLKYTAKHADGDDAGKMKYVFNCDAVQDKLGLTFAMKDEEDDLEISLEADIDDIVQGESCKVDLDKMIFSMDGEEVFRIAGDIEIEPLRTGIAASVKPETAFFEMTIYDWERIIDQIDKEYGSILNSLW